MKKERLNESSILEIGGGVYWFDMGEGCARSAYLSGIDVTRTKAIFVSHPHIDHIGGMANVFHLFNKLIGKHGMSFANGGAVEICFPDLELFASVKQVALGGRHSGAKLLFGLNEHQIRDGVIFEDENIRVTAKGNRHLPGDGADGTYHSFSFLVEADGKRIIFSGDVKRPDELDGLIGGGVDLLIMETGHHKVSDVCEYAASRNVARLRFNHHGREILGNRAAAEALAAEYTETRGISIKLTHDGLVEEY